MFDHAPLEIALVRVRCPKCGATVPNPQNNNHDWTPLQVLEVARCEPWNSDTRYVPMCGQCGAFVLPETPIWIDVAANAEIQRAEVQEVTS